jgi:hypothetical protein
LFAINGLGANDHDPIIPKQHFEAAIEKVSESTTDGAALKVCLAWNVEDRLTIRQFQYMALARFAAMMHKRFMLMKTGFNTSNLQNFRLDEELRSKEMDILALKEELDERKGYELKYKKWKSREPEVTKYLHAYAALVRYEN